MYNRDQWLNTLRHGEYNISQYNDSANDSQYCALGVLLESAMTNSHEYKPTIRDKFNRLRARFGMWLGSKISGYNLTPDYY